MTAVRLEKADVEGRYTLVGSLTFESVPYLAEDADHLFTDSPALSIDLGRVGRVDSAGLALLVDWTRQAREGDQVIRFEQVPAQLLEIARVSGLDNILPLYREADA
ncbi:MAG: STAS domain-containing protein [Ectothiorhodospiraceae bacterium]